jgi:hypothetical protein
MNKLMQLWKNYCLNKWDQKSHAPDSPIQRLIRVILHYAVENDADCIVFGEPIKPYDVIEMPKPKHLENGISLEEMNKIDLWLEDMENEMKNEIECLDPFKMSPLKEIPVWYCSKGKCYQIAPLKLSIINSVIAGLLYYAKQEICTSIDGHEYKVVYSIGMQDNYCYFIKIEHVEK